MHPNELLERLKSEVGQWRTRLDELRLKAGLGKLELRDKRDEVLRSFDSSYRDARRRLDEVREDTDQEVGRLKRSVEAGWKELRRTYEEMRSERE